MKRPPVPISDFIFHATNVLSPPEHEILASLNPVHPRLFLDAGSVTQLRHGIAVNERLRRWNEALVRNAEACLRNPAPTQDIVVRRGMLSRVSTMGLLYLLTGDARLRDRLWSDLEIVAGFPDWRPRVSLDSSEMTMAFGLAYDWLFHDWSEAQRGLIRRAMRDKGFAPAIERYDGKLPGWHDLTFNWNQVCNGGTAIGALAVAGEEPELCAHLVRSSLLSMPRAMLQFAPDGGSIEGSGYWDYAITFTVYLIAGLQQALGTDFGLSMVPGLAEAGDYQLHISSPLPDRAVFNYSDSGPTPPNSPALLWLAKRYGRPDWATFQLEKADWDAAQGAGNDMIPFNMIWFDPGCAEERIRLPCSAHFRYTEVATFRSSWYDEGGTFLGVRAGDNRHNHGHLDKGSFVYFTDGVRWAIDLAGDSYSLPGFSDVAKRRWDIYRLRAEGHNTLVINGDARADQDPTAATELIHVQDDARMTCAIADLTPAYRDHGVHRYHRGWRLFGRRDLMVQDEIEATRPSEVWWFMHTQAEIAIAESGRSATLRSDGRILTVRLCEPAGCAFEVLPARPLPGSPDVPGQNPNHGMSKLAIRIQGASELRIRVLLLPGGERSVEPHAETLPLNRWQTPPDQESP